MQPGCIARTGEESAPRGTSAASVFASSSGIPHGYGHHPFPGVSAHAVGSGFYPHAGPVAFPPWVYPSVYPMSHVAGPMANEAGAGAGSQSMMMPHGPPSSSQPQAGPQAYGRYVAPGSQAVHHGGPALGRESFPLPTRMHEAGRGEPGIDGAIPLPQPGYGSGYVPAHEMGPAPRFGPQFPGHFHAAGSYSGTGSGMMAGPYIGPGMMAGPYGGAGMMSGPYIGPGMMAGPYSGPSMMSVPRGHASSGMMSAGGLPMSSGGFDGAMMGPASSAHSGRHPARYGAGAGTGTKTSNSARESKPPSKSESDSESDSEPDSESDRKKGEKLRALWAEAHDATFSRPQSQAAASGATSSRSDAKRRGHKKERLRRKPTASHSELRGAAELEGRRHRDDHDDESDSPVLHHGVRSKPKAAAAATSGSHLEAAHLRESSSGVSGGSPSASAAGSHWGSSSLKQAQPGVGSKRSRSLITGSRTAPASSGAPSRSPAAAAPPHTGSGAGASGGNAATLVCATRSMSTSLRRLELGVATAATATGSAAANTAAASTGPSAAATGTSC